MTTAGEAGLRVLAIGAHPDDIELGCGGSLAKLAREGAAVRAVIVSRGRRGTLSDADRAAETERALALLGIADVAVLDFEDTALAGALNPLVAALETHVRAFRPTRVYTMFQHDRHQDHRTVYEASAIACRAVPQLLGYETPSSYPNFMPTVFQAIDGFLDLKLRALDCHRSQADRLYMQGEKVRAAAHFRGAQIGLGPSEGFIPYRITL